MKTTKALSEEIVAAASEYIEDIKILDQAIIETTLLLRELTEIKQKIVIIHLGRIK